MTLIPCPQLGVEVELTEEREQHIQRQHPDLLPTHRERIIETISDPDEIRRSTRVGNAKLFSKRFDDLSTGKYVVAVVVTDPGRGMHPWIITSYVARKLKEGEIEWRRS